MPASEKLHTNGLTRRSIALSSFKSSSPGWIAHRCSLRRPCASRPGHFDGLCSMSMVAKSRSISPLSRISRRLAPGGLASHGRPRNAVSPIRNCQNRRMARDLLRKGRAHNSGPEPRRLRRRHAVRLQASRRANRQIVATATKAANVFFILGPPVLAWRAASDRRTTPRHQEIPAAARQSPGGPSYQIN